MTLPIEFDHVSHRYGTTTALDDVGVTLGAGQIHGLLGRNGSGKTTLLSLAAAFMRPTAGTVRIDGEPVFENAAASTRVCLIRGSGDTIEQDWPDDRVRNALDFAAAVRPRWDADYADSLLDRFEVHPRKRIGQLSRGQRAALGITLGLACRAPVTMFDESYLGMDAPSRYAFYDELLADVMAHPRTVVISTHHIEELAPLLERVTILEAGRVILAEDTETLREHGVTVTGPEHAVERFVAGRDVLAEKQLGRTRSAALYGELAREAREEAAAAGLDLGPLPLQDLFIHLTSTRKVRS